MLDSFISAAELISLDYGSGDLVFDAVTIVTVFLSALTLTLVALKRNDRRSGKGSRVP